MIERVCFKEKCSSYQNSSETIEEKEGEEFDLLWTIKLCLQYVIGYDRTVILYI